MTTLEALRVDVIGLNCSTGPGAHARADPLSSRATRRARSRASRTPGFRSTPAPATRSIRSSRRRWPQMLGEFVRAVRRAHRRRLLRHDARSISSAIVERGASGESDAAHAADATAAGTTQHRACRASSARCARSRLRPGSAAAAHRRARERAGLAQGEAPAPRRRLRGHRRRRARAGGVGRARARRLRRASPSAPTKPSRWRRS